MTSTPPRETALVTGASSGIGLELARLFAADGSALVLVARSGDKLEALAQELRERHAVAVRVIAKDLADPAASDEIAAELARNGIDIDVLVNNAGFGLGGQFVQLSLDRQMEMIQVNVAALVKLTGLLLPAMVKRRRGGILNVGSTAAFQPGPNMAIYFASKAFVLSFSEALADEVRPHGITVTCLAPGPVATNFAAAASLENSRLFQQNVLDVRKVAEAGYRALRGHKTLVVPGLMNKLGVFAVRFAPRSLVRKISGRLADE
jgi:short-subunit dehydrogenase